MPANNFARSFLTRISEFRIEIVKVVLQAAILLTINLLYASLIMASFQLCTTDLGFLDIQSVYEYTLNISAV